jgi:RNA polymerase sigma-70 factor (ECF subfamily)
VLLVLADELHQPRVLTEALVRFVGFHYTRGMVTAGAHRETYREVLVAARRFARSEDDARDLTQDVLEIALARGVDDWCSAERRAWLRGVVRRHAAFVVRGERRRRQRELGAQSPDAAGVGTWMWQPKFLASLPRSVRSVATLASADWCASEIRWLLQLSDTALRQRLTALRRALSAHDEPPTVPVGEPARGFGPLRAQLLANLRRRGGRAVVTHDPDGHVLFLKMAAHKTGSNGNR